jgi:hypothetical protein
MRAAKFFAPDLLFGLPLYMTALDADSFRKGAIFCAPQMKDTQSAAVRSGRTRKISRDFSTVRSAGAAAKQSPFSGVEDDMPRDRKPRDRKS